MSSYVDNFDSTKLVIWNNSNLGLCSQLVYNETGPQMYA